MKDNGGCFLNAFLVLGLIVLALTLTYRLACYARYLYFDKTEVVLDWAGGEQEIWVSTDGNSWTIDDKETAWWLSYQELGNCLRISAYQNNDKEERSVYVKINSGSIKRLGNKWAWLRVVQNGRIENVVYEQTNKLETFAEFWKSFCNDPAFQKSRIKFPLLLTYYEETFDDWGSVTKKTDYVYATEWRFDDFKDTPEYQVLIEKKDGVYSVIQAGRECGIHVEYFFESNNGKWYLVRVEDISN